MLRIHTESNENFNHYSEIVKQYVRTGVIPASYTKEYLLKKLSALSESEKKSLIGAIEFEFSLTSWDFIGPLFVNIPKAAKWSIVAGIAGGVMEHQVFRDLPSSIAIGITTSIVTFFGQQAYKSQKVNTMWNAREQRANEFLKPLRVSLQHLAFRQPDFDSALLPLGKSS